MIQMFLQSMIFVLVAALAGHLLFSRFGFNPTDDGFILAVANRIRKGQVPHRDFISIRLALSHVLHLPEFWFGGSKIIKRSRLVFWLEMALASWLWTHFLGLKYAFLWGAVCFCLSVNIFPAMAWHTVDAILITTTGFFLMPSWIGFLILGIAPLCRQNFIFILPVAAVLWKSPWAAVSLLPLISYVVWIGLAGGLSDLKSQLTTHNVRALMKTGLVDFINPWTGIGLVSGWLVMRGTPYEISPGIVFLLMVSMLIRGRADQAAYFLFGSALPMLFYHEFIIAAAALALAWISSFSIGYPYPALMMGPLFLAVYSLPFDRISNALSCAIISMTGLVVLRFYRIYRQPKTGQLKSHLGDVMQGGKGIYTNILVYEFLEDLDRIKKEIQTSGSAYCIVPDVAVHWIDPEISNPIPCDWPQETELADPASLRRVVESIRSHPDLMKIVQKYEAKSLGTGLKPLSGKYRVVKFIEQNYRKTSESRFFCIYGNMLLNKDPADPS